MPPIATRVSHGTGDTIATNNAQPVSIPNVPADPQYSPILRCPLPSLAAYPDDLRQFYRFGVPQNRLIPLPLMSNQ